jgi:hypothetical protein
MNELQWLASDDPGEMMEFLNFREPSRKKRLFGVAVCNHVWHLIEEECGRDVLAKYEEEVDSKSGLC